MPDVRSATLVFSDMVDAGVDPTERTFGALLDCYAKARDLESACRVFGSLKGMGLQPNVQVGGAWWVGAGWGGVEGEGMEASRGGGSGMG